MSKYIDALRSSRPEHLYVLDLDRTALTAGTVTDLGSNPVNGTVNETGSVGIEVARPLIEGLERSLKFNVVHDRQLNDPAEGYGIINIFDSDNYFGPDSENFLIEMVVYVPDYNRSRSGFETPIGSPLFHLFMNAQHCGFSNYRVDNDNFRFGLKMSNSTGSEDLFLNSPTFPTNALYHIALQRRGDSFSLYVNGELVATERKTLTFDVDPDAMRIGGFVSVRHSDSTIQSFASWSSLVDGDEITERYAKITPKNNYSAVVDAFSPRLAITNEPDGSVGVLEPGAEKLSSGTSSIDFYEDATGALKMQPTVLSPNVTKSKLQYFDLTGLTAGVSSFIDVSVATNAQTDFGIFYSIDGTNYTEITEGEDQIPELDANWGSAV